MMKRTTWKNYDSYFRTSSCMILLLPRLLRILPFVVVAAFQPLPFHAFAHHRYQRYHQCFDSVPPTGIHFAVAIEHEEETTQTTGTSNWNVRSLDEEKILAESTTNNNNNTQTSLLHRRRLPAWPPRDDPDFFINQLEICQSIVEICDNSDATMTTFETESPRRQQQQRHRFKEHSRCTARFGEVLRHAYSTVAPDSVERLIALDNAQAILKHVDLYNGRARPGLATELARALTSKEIREFRLKQLEAGTSIVSNSDNRAKTSNSTRMQQQLEVRDQELLGRLYYSAILAATPALDELKLSKDFVGITALLALLRATTANNDNNGGCRFESNGGSHLESAVSNHFNGVKARGARFHLVKGGTLLSEWKARRVAAQQGNSTVVADDTQQEVAALDSSFHRSKEIAASVPRQLVVAFSSLGNGLVRQEFAGSLGKLLASSTNLESAATANSSMFDVLFVADPAQSWYQRASDASSFDGFEEFEHRIEEVSKNYEFVTMLGDSMGGSGALLFAHLATNVIAMVPQISLANDPHISRDDFAPEVRIAFEEQLYKSITTALEKKQTNIVIHRGVYNHDINQLTLLEERIPTRTVSAMQYFSLAQKVNTIAEGGVLDDSGGKAEILISRDDNKRRATIVEHGDCTHHQLSPFLKENGKLPQVLRLGIRW